MTGLKLEVSARTVGKPDAFFIDGCAIFCVVAKYGNYWIPRQEFSKICDTQVRDCRCLPLIDTMLILSKVWPDLIVTQGQVVYITWHSIHLYKLKMWYWKLIRSS